MSSTRGSTREMPTRGPLVIGSRVVGASWNQGDVVLEHRRWVCADESFPASRSTHARITLTDTGRTERTVLRIEGRVAYDGADRPGAVSYVPAAVEREYSYQGADLTYTSLWVEAEHAQALVGDESGEAVPVLNGRDHVVRLLLSELQADIRLGLMPSTLYVEHVAATALLRMTRVRRASERPVRLGDRQIEHLREYIDANLGAHLSVRQLAAVSDLPTDQFARSFRLATGQPPYAYVLERRVAQAQHLLRTSAMPVVEIAHTVGFSSQSHLTSTFRKHTGLTPLQHRHRFNDT